MNKVISIGNQGFDKIRENDAKESIEEHYTL